MIAGRCKECGEEFTNRATAEACCRCPACGGPSRYRHRCDACADLAKQDARNAYLALPVATDADAWWSEIYELMEEDLDVLREQCLDLNSDANLAAYPAYESSFRKRLGSRHECAVLIEDLLARGYGDAEPPSMPPELVTLCEQVDQIVDQITNKYIWWHIDFTQRAPLPNEQENQDGV